LEGKPKVRTWVKLKKHMDKRFWAATYDDVAVEGLSQNSNKDKKLETKGEYKQGKNQGKGHVRGCL